MDDTNDAREKILNVLKHFLKSTELVDPTVREDLTDYSLNNLLDLFFNATEQQLASILYFLQLNHTSAQKQVDLEKMVLDIVSARGITPDQSLHVFTQEVVNQDASVAVRMSLFDTARGDKTEKENKGASLDSLLWES